MYSLIFWSLLVFLPNVTAIPAVAGAIVDRNPLAHPIANALLPIAPHTTKRFNLFTRQGCPNLTLLCPSGVCCGYDNPCCGNVCCNAGYVCSGGTAAAPCCVAIGSPTNTCGSSSGNPCSRPGDLLCNGINICCPPSNLCYYDENRVARCSPLASSSVPIPTTIFSRSSSIYILPTATSSTTSTTTSSQVLQSATFPPSPPTSGSTSFWTPAAIGGVAGGAAGGLILLGLVVYLLCSSKRRRGNARPPESHIVTPLSDEKISSLIRYLDTPESWQKVYISEAQRMRGAPHVDPVAWMTDFATRAVSIRIEQLRGGEASDNARTRAALLGFIPLGKVLDSWLKLSTKKFTRVIFETTGLGDPTTVAELYKQSQKAMSSGLSSKLMSGAKWVGKHAFDEWWTNSEAADHLQQEMVESLGQELGQDIATELLQELVHIKPWLGQAYSVGKAVNKCNTRMMKVLDWLYPKALEFHLKVLAVNALVEVIPEGERGITEKAESYPYVQVNSVY